MSFNLEDLEGPTTRILTAPGVDLTTISSRRVRRKLLEDSALSLTAEGLKQRKTEVDNMILNIYQNVSRQAQAEELKRKRDEDTGEGTEQDAEDQEEALEKQDAEEMGEDENYESPPPPRKKKSVEKSIEEADAELARKLSSEINSRSRRGASNGAPATPKKRKMKKSAEMVDSGDEMDKEKPKKKRSGGAKGGFGKEYMLSESLSVVVGVDKLSRPQVVKKIWEYIHSHELQNPSKRREIICDDAMRAVFGTDKVDMFRMNKVLGRHLHTE